MGKAILKKNMSKKNISKKIMLKKKNAISLVACLAVFVGLGLTGTDRYVYAQGLHETDNVKNDDGNPDGTVIYRVDDAVEIGKAMEAAGMEKPYAESLDKKDQDVAADSVYRLKRIIVYADEFPDICGASSVVCYDKYNYYILGFDSEEDTKTAYRYLVGEYGSDSCMPDQMIYSEDVYDDGISGQAALAESGKYDAVSWGTAYMGMDKLKAEVSGYSVASDVDIAVIDTGINASDTLFDGRINTADSVNCYDDETAGDFSDKLGHGSHVAGIIADATPDNAKLTIIKCFSDSGSTAVSVVQRGIMAALDRGVDIINMSLCFYGTNANENTRAMLDPLIEQANNENVVICVAAGNANRSVNNWGISDVEGVSYPADSRNVITVSALMQKPGTEDTADKVAAGTVTFADTYSYYGDAVDFSAPGSYITSAWMNGTGHSHVNSGTSMAAPYISAAAAYVKMTEPSVSNAELKARLIDYSVDLGDVGKDVYYGYGCPYMADYFRDHAEKKKQPLGRCKLNSIKNIQEGLSISWTAVDGAEGYKICRKSTGESYSCVYTVGGSANSFVDKNVTAGKKYRYMIRPVGDSGIGAAENAVELLRLTQPKPVAANGYKGMVVSWNKISGATMYNVYRKKSGNTAWTLIRTVTGSADSITDSSANKGTTYIYTVKAYGSGAWSSYDTVGSAMYRLTTTKITSVTSPSRRLVSVKWSKAAEVSGYLIQYSDTKTFAKYKNIMVSGKSVAAKNITVKNAGAVYYFRMRNCKNVNGRIYYGGWTAARKVIAGK